MTNAPKIVLCWAVFFTAGSLQAQYAMDMRLQHTAYIQFEAMEVHIVLRNDTDRMLLIGGLRETASLDFSITKHGESVKRRSRGLLVENVLIMPGQTREMAVDLGRHYDVQTLGQYEITGLFSADGTRFQCLPRVVDVVPGLELTSAYRAVPNHPGMRRKYTLKYWARKEREMLFLSISDEKGVVNYGVFMLGPMVRVTPPELTVDGAGNVLVKHQADNGVFAHTTFKSTVDGVTLVRQQIKTDDAKVPGGPVSK